MGKDAVAAAGPLGGSANEHGSEFRAGVAAWLMAHAATSRPVPGLDLASSDSVPLSVRVETDDMVDDLEVVFTAGNRALLQCKAGLNLETKASSAFGKAVAQWSAQVESGIADGERLVTATCDPSRPIRALATALDRRRDPLAGRPSRRESKALKRLEAHLSSMDPADRERLLDHASILSLDLDTEGKGDAGVASEMFDASVVGPGQGRGAFHAIREQFRHRAVIRSGLDLDRMIDVLREDGLQLSVDADASAAARRLATRMAVDRFRALQRQRAAEIDLRQLGVASPPIAAVGLGEHQGVVVGDESAHAIDPMRALRRRSRALIVGSTGTGKTVLLRQLAAADLGEATGIFVPLPRVMRTGLDGDPVETLITAAVLDAPADDQPLIADRIRQATTEGTLLLALDALDETRERRFDVVSWISRLVGQLHPGVEVVVATRSSAYAAATTLGFHELGVAALDGPGPIARPVLEALSPDTSPTAREAWTAERLSWVDESYSEAKLRPTPLVAAVLAVLAAQMAADALPSGRSELLNRLVDRIAQTWERRIDRAADFAGGLTADETTSALMHGFAVLGWAVGVAGNATVESVAETIASDMVAEWGMASARASVFGNEAVHFWDEAGVISIGDDGSTIETGLRVLTELGAARLLASASEPDDDIDRILGEDTLHDVAVLAAGMSAEVAAAVVDRAVLSGTTDGFLAAARGCADGEPAPDVVVRLIEAVLSCDANEDDLVRLGTEVASLSVPASHRSDVLDGLRRRLPDHVAAVLCALAMANWRMDGYQGVVVSALRAGPPPRTPTGARALFIDDRPIKVAFDSLAVEGARTLDPTEEEIREVLEEAASAASLGLLRRLDRATRGRGVVLKPRERDLGFDHAAFMRAREETDRAFRAFLRLIAECGPPRPLTWGERRQLNELARLFTGLRISDSHPRDLDVAIDGSIDDLRALVGAVIATASLDVERLAAEAAEALTELRDDGPKNDVSLLLMDSAGDEITIEWDRIDASLLLGLLGSTRWIALVAATLLDSAPSGQRLDLADQVAAVAEGLGPWHRHLAGELVVRLDSSNSKLASWSDGGDALLRCVAAGAAAERGDSEVLGKLLSDEDATVRYGGLIHISPGDVAMDGDLRAMIESAGADAIAVRTCRWCGHANPSTGEPNCSECGLALPDPTRGAKAILDGRELSYEGESTQTVVVELGSD